MASRNEDRSNLQALLAAVGFRAADVARYTGLGKMCVSKRMRGIIKLSEEDAFAIAKMSRLPYSEIMLAHELDLKDNNRSPGKPKWRDWTDEEDARLCRMMIEGVEYVRAAQELDRTLGAIRERCTVLKIRRAAPPRKTDYVVSAPALQLLSDEDIAALYAGRTYGGDTRKPGTVNPILAPHRPIDISGCGSTAQMCVELAR